MNGNKKIEKLKLEALGRISTEEFKLIQKIPVIIVLDNVRSMHNVGSVFRTSDAFKVEKIILCGISPKPPHREINKTALGATDSVDWEYNTDIKDTLQNLKADHYTVLGVEQVTHSINLLDYTIKDNLKYVLVFGNEVEGLNEEAFEYYDNFLEIPQEGTKHSLNISVCTGVVLWEFYKNLT